MIFRLRSIQYSHGLHSSSRTIAHLVKYVVCHVAVVQFVKFDVNEISETEAHDIRTISLDFTCIFDAEILWLGFSCHIKSHTDRVV